MAEIRTLPGVMRADLEPSTSVDAVICSALNAGLMDIVVVGRSLKGELCLWGSQADADAVLGLLVRGLNWLAEKQQVPMDEDQE